MISKENQSELKLGLVQIPVALNESNGGNIFWMYASASMAIYATEMTKLEAKGKLVTLQPGSSQLFSKKNDFTMNNEVNQSSMNKPSLIVFHYFLEGDVDVAHYTTTNALFNVEIKTIQLHHIFFEDQFLNQ